MSKLLNELKKHSSLKRKKANEGFFKTGKREYGEGDKFIGVSVPDIRKVAKGFYGKFDLKDFEEILNSPIHEERLAGLFILVEKYKNSPKQVFKFYIKNAKRVNNWDLVDLSAPNILGNYLLEHEEKKSILYKLAKSKNLWERRISILATFPFIRKGYVDECFKISKILLGDSHDLIHKAVGWMLREAWKKRPEKVERFLMKNYNKIPRTTLRYSIERMEEAKRKRFLNHLSI